MSMRFIRYLDRHYRKRGYHVYSRHLSHLQTAPPTWKGPLPDMLVEQGGHRVAIFSETSETLSDSGTPAIWRRAIEENSASVKIFVRRKSDLNLVETVLQKENLVAEIGLVKKETFRPFGVRFSRRRTVQTMVVLLLFLLASFGILWFVSFLYDYQIQFYEPRDLERGAAQEENIQ
ncbi:MAG: hypothetical protein V3T61_04665 [Acidobacteriota bacterium]